jgi:hypothetical protein
MVMYFNPLKVLMPVALFLLVLGVAKGIFDMVGTRCTSRSTPSSSSCPD